MAVETSFCLFKSPRFLHEGISVGIVRPCWSSVELLGQVTREQAEIQCLSFQIKEMSHLLEQKSSLRMVLKLEKNSM